MSQRPILPMAYAASRAWLIKWDKFVIPVPFFARVAIAIGPPRYVPRVTGAAASRAPAGRDGAGAQATVRRRARGTRGARMTGAHAPRPARGPRTVRAAELPPLVMRCGAFGDMVLLTVLLEQLHARLRRPVDVIASGPWTRAAARRPTRRRAAVPAAQPPHPVLAVARPARARGAAARAWRGTDLVLRPRRGARAPRSCRDSRGLHLRLDRVPLRRGREFR